MRTSRLDWIDQFVIFDFVSPVGHQNLYAMDWARFIGVPGETWPVILAGNGNINDAFGGYPYCGYLESNNHKYTHVIRAGFRVRSGYIPLTANIIAARLKLYTVKQNTPTTPPTFTLCSVPTALPFTNNGNYQNVGNIPLSDVVAWNNLPNPGIYPFELNASGILNINLGHGNYSGFSLRMKNFDVDGIEPDISAGPKEVRVVCTGPGGNWGTYNVYGLWQYAVIQSDPNDCYLEVDYESVPLVGSRPATAITATTATLNGILGLDGGLSCTCWFEYGLTNAYGNSTVPQVVIDGAPASPGLYSANINGLLPNKTYHFRAVAQNSLGTSVGLDTTLTTPLVIPSVSTLPAAGITRNQAVISGHLDSDGGEPCTCYLTWSQHDFGRNTPTTMQVTGENFSHTISGLLPGETYYFFAVAQNSAGAIGGMELQFTTLSSPSGGAIPHKLVAAGLI